MRSRLPFDCPAYSQQRRKDSPSASARPLIHAALNEMFRSSGPASPCSRRSARMRRASAWTLAVASSGVAPYVITPGSSTTSAIHRPSSSCSISIRKVMAFSTLLDAYSGVKPRVPVVIWPRRASACNMPSTLEMLREYGSNTLISSSWRWPQGNVTSVSLTFSISP